MFRGKSHDQWLEERSLATVDIISVELMQPKLNTRVCSGLTYYCLVIFNASLERPPQEIDKCQFAVWTNPHLVSWSLTLTLMVNVVAA